MKRATVFLSLLLLVQLGLALALYLGGAGALSANNAGKLLSFELARVDAIDLVGSDGQQLSLKKGADGWILPKHFSSPADNGKVEKLLSTLTKLTRPWPVAKTAAAGKRFKLADQDFERKLIFHSQGKTLATLLLGSSPGFRKVHARLAGEKSVYDIPFSTFQASLKTEDWVDQQQLRFKAGAINAIELPDCRLTRRDGKLQLDALADNEQTNADQAQQLLDRLANLNIRDIYGKADRKLPHPVELRVKLTLKNGTSRDYGFAKGDKAGTELLQVAGSPYLFEVNSGLIDALKGYDHTKLAEQKPPAAPANHPTGKAAAQPQAG